MLGNIYRDKLPFLFKFNNIPGSDTDTQLSVVSSLPVMGWTQSSPPHMLFADPHASFWWFLAGSMLLLIHLWASYFQKQSRCFLSVGFFFSPQTGSRLWLQLAGSVHMLLWVSLGKDTGSFPCSQGWALCLLTVDAGLCKLPTVGSYFLMIF